MLRKSATWFWLYQLPGLVKAWLLPRRSPVPAELLWQELRGCLAGPRAYLRARRKLQEQAR